MLLHVVLKPLTHIGNASPVLMLECPETLAAKTWVLHGEAKIAYEVHSIIFISNKTGVHIANLSVVNAAIVNPSQEDRERRDTGCIYLVSIQNDLTS